MGSAPFRPFTLIINSDGKGKLSKRHESSSVDYYRKAGFLPEAVLNYLSNIVWNHPQGKEIYDITDFIAHFDIESLNSQGARFDIKKLTWMNGEYIRRCDPKVLAQKVYEFSQNKYPLDLIEKLIPLAQVRMKVLGEFTQFIQPFIRYIPIDIGVTNKKLLLEFNSWINQETDWTARNLETKAKAIVLEKKLQIRDAFMALRLAVTGEKVGLPLFETLEIMGKTEVINRLKRNL